VFVCFDGCLGFVLYLGGVFKLELFLPEEYPMAAPKVPQVGVFHCGAFSKSHFYVTLYDELQIIENFLLRFKMPGSWSCGFFFESQLFFVILNLLILVYGLMHFLVFGS